MNCVWLLEGSYVQALILSQIAFWQSIMLISVNRCYNFIVLQPVSDKTFFCTSIDVMAYNFVFSVKSLQDLYTVNILVTGSKKQNG